MGLIIPAHGRASMDRLAAINVFVAIAEAGSLSAAGRRLGMPLTTVSRHLAGLENHVGVRLVTRTTRDLVLTEAGLHYLDSCRRIIAGTACCRGAGGAARRACHNRAGRVRPAACAADHD
jgi:DNA-binding transcriptional LysR family regulator